MISGWAIANVILGILIVITAGRSIWYFWDYIRIYRTPKIFLAIIMPPIIIGWLWLWVIVYYEWIGYPPLRWPGFVPIVEVISFTILMLYYGLLLTFFGSGMKLRRKYRKFNDWGPYFTFGTPNADGSPSIRASFIVHPQSHPDPLKMAEIIPKPPNLIINPSVSSEKDKKSIQGVHTIEISGLLPNQQYKILLLNSKKECEIWSPLPLNPNESIHVLPQFDFLVVGDLHAGENDLEPLVDRILSQHEGSKFILTLGDIVRESQNRRYWQTFFGQMEKLLVQFPFMYIPGNHDGYTNARKRPWRQIINQPYADLSDGGYFSLNYGRIHFILLDGYNVFGKFGRMSSKQLAWLDKDLQVAEMNSAITHIILCLHKPPYSTGDVGVDPWLSQEIDVRIKRWKKVNVVFSGHCHFYQHFMQPIPDAEKHGRQVHFFVSGGGGGRLEKSVLQKIRFYRRPYYWTADGSDSQPHFIPYSRFVKNNQNNEFITKYHQKSRIFRHYIQVKVTEDMLLIKVFGWDGNCFDEIKIK
jgi:predicted phosphodiesterase